MNILVPGALYPPCPHLTAICIVRSFLYVIIICVEIRLCYEFWNWFRSQDLTQDVPLFILFLPPPSPPSPSLYLKILYMKIHISLPHTSSRKKSKKKKGKYWNFFGWLGISWMLLVKLKKNSLLFKHLLLFIYFLLMLLFLSLVNTLVHHHSLFIYFNK